MANNTFRHRIGWEKYLKPFLYKELPSSTGWSATLGTLCALLFMVMAVSGVFLAVYYNPSPDKAYQTIDFIMRDVPGGSVLRGIHHWGAGAMVTVVFIHMMVNFFSGAYRAPREFTWIAGAALFIITLMLGFTGYLLPWDMKAYWATVVSANIPKDIPVLGNFMSQVLLGGDTVSGLTLTRFYAIHTLLLPALLMAFTIFHIYMVRVHGLAEDTDPKAGAKRASDTEAAKLAVLANGADGASAADGQETPAAARPGVKERLRRLYRFYPEHMNRSCIVFGCVFAAILLLAVYGAIPREDIAGTFIENYLPRPEWYYMWLFQLLTYFPGSWEVVGSLGIPVIGCIFLFAVPFLTRNPLHGIANRPVALAAGSAGVVCIVYLTWVGFMGIKPYGLITPVPDRQMSVSEQRGLVVYNEKECAYCHQIEGRGGVRTGPDMANMARKGRTVEYMAKYIKNPAAVDASSIMPKYDLPKKDLEALAAFILAVDSRKGPMKTLTRDEVLKSARAAEAEPRQQ